MQKNSEFNTRPCTRCGTPVIDVRDAYTLATFPVNAESVSQEGLVLTPNKDTRKNPFAHDAVVFVPHLPLCKSPEPEVVLEVEETTIESRGPAPIEDPGALPPGGMAGEVE